MRCGIIVLTFSESIARTNEHFAHVSHATGSLCSSSSCLLTPIIYTTFLSFSSSFLSGIPLTMAHAGGWESTGSATPFLLVKGASSTTRAYHMRLGLAFAYNVRAFVRSGVCAICGCLTKTASSFSCFAHVVEGRTLRRRKIRIDGAMMLTDNLSVRPILSLSFFLHISLASSSNEHTQLTETPRT